MEISNLENVLNNNNNWCAMTFYLYLCFSHRRKIPELIVLIRKLGTSYFPWITNSEIGRFWNTKRIRKTRNVWLKYTLTFVQICVDDFTQRWKDGISQRWFLCQSNTQNSSDSFKWLKKRRQVQVNRKSFNTKLLAVLLLEFS